MTQRKSLVGHMCGHQSVRIEEMPVCSVCIRNAAALRYVCEAGKDGGFIAVMRVQS